MTDGQTDRQLRDGKDRPAYCSAVKTPRDRLEIETYRPRLYIPAIYVDRTCCRTLSVRRFVARLFSQVCRARNTATKAHKLLSKQTPGRTVPASQMVLDRRCQLAARSSDYWLVTCGDNLQKSQCVCVCVCACVRQGRGGRWVRGSVGGQSLDSVAPFHVTLS